jgi:pimeloyl-ACP methyl ester carboxylesterase
MNHVISKDGTSIAYDRAGEGPPLILMGGALNDRRSVAELAERMSQSFTVYNYDRRGRNGSGDTEPYAVERELEDLQALIDVAGGSALLFANCTGGMLALEAVSAGQAITRLALYEPPYLLDGPHARLDEEYRRRLSELVEAGRLGDAVEHFMVNAVGFTPDAVGRIRMAPIWPMLESLAPSLRYDAVLAGDNSLPTGLLPSITLPTLVIDGADSPQWARDPMQTLVDLLPDGRRVSLEGHNHNLVADAVAPVLLEFFRAGSVDQNEAA